MKNLPALFRASLLAVCVLTVPGVAQRQFSVNDFGAAGDGVTLDTKAIQSAVDACSPVGGVVVFERGTYLTGSIQLRSNVEIRIEAGATILGSANIADYFERTPKIQSLNNAFLKHSLFYAEGQSNISITGHGVIDGQGAAFRVVTKEKPARYRNRPYIIRFVECTNVTVENVTMMNSASWMQHYLACEGLVIRGIRVMNHANLNNDMMDIDGCRNVIVSDCIGDTDDDAITLKSTSERITENVTISNCILSSHCNAIKAGTESTGGFRNIAISNMVVKPSAVKTVKSGRPGGSSGISLEMVDGGMLIGVTISNVIIDGAEVPIFIRLGNRGRKHWEGAPQPGVGYIHGISLSHIIGRNAGRTGCSITGIPGHLVSNVVLNDVRIDFAGLGEVKSPEGLEELEAQYPEATMWGALPAYGMYVRHVEGLRMDNCSFAYSLPDARPPIVLDDARGVRINGCELMVSDSARHAIGAMDVWGLRVMGTTFIGETESLFRVTGEYSRVIEAFNNDARGVRILCDPTSTHKSALTGAGNVFRKK